MTPLVKTEKSVKAARPLRVLAALIKEDLRAAEQAAEQARQVYWEPIGDKLEEARGQFDTVAEFYAWAKHQFGFGETQTRKYLIAVTHETNHTAVRQPTLEGHLRSIGRSNKPTSAGGVRQPAWREEVNDLAERARASQERITRLHEDNLTRQQEREAERALALKLIDIGYKVLAKELHPDKGGSRDAMQRLGRVRDRLKQHA